MIKNITFVKYFEDEYQSYIDKFKNIDTILLFDLEDSIQDIFDNSKTYKLKQYYRTVLINIIKHNKITFPHKVGIRINSPSTDHFDNDISLLKELYHFHFDIIVLPKVNHSSDIRKFLEFTEKRGIEYKELGIVVETITGMNNLEDILEYRHSKYKYVFFGFIDLNYDYENIPFVHQNNHEFWNWIEYVAGKMKNSDKIYVNPPAFNILSPEYFSWIIEKTYEIFQKDFYQLCVMYYQVVTCNQFQRNIHYNSELYLDHFNPDKIKYAAELIHCVNETNKNKGFSITQKSFITPHEYYTAQKYLRRTYE